MKKNAIAGAGLALILALAPASLAFAEDPVAEPIETPVSAPVVAEEEAPVIVTPEPDPVAAEERTAPPVEPIEEIVEELVTPAEFVAYEATARWLIPATWDYDTTPYYTAAIFPQPPLVGDVPCGQWSQDDVYWIDSLADEALLAALDDDGVLTQGEDSAIYKSHVFTKGPECVTPVLPAPCVVDGSWYTEGDDLAPVATPSGLLFEGGSGKAVGTRLPITGNLQGWGSVSFTATGGTEQFFYRIVIDASADGGKAYQSLSFPGYTTIDSSSVSYQFGETLAETAARFPNNVLKSAGFQTNSGAPEGFEAVLSSVTGACGTFDFTYTPEPEVVVPNPQAVIVATCGAATATLTNPGSESVVTQTASFIIEVDGEFYGAYAVEADGSLDVPFTFAEDSGDHIIQVFQAGISEWAKIAEAQVESDCVTPEPTPTPEEPTETPVPVTPATTAANLAQTGANPVAPWIGGGILALLLGVGATLLARRSQRTE